MCLFGIRRLGYLFLAGGVLATCAGSNAAELRTSAGNRPVSRTVPASHAAPSATSPQVVRKEVIESESYVEEYAGHDNGGCSECCGRFDQGCQMCQTCCFRSCGMWVDAEFLLGWRHGVRFPALVTTSPAGTAAGVAGVLNRATTTVVYPTEPIGEEARPGGRIAVGGWLDPYQCWGVEGRFFMLADERTQFSATSTGNPILARPFFDLVANAPASRLIAFPGVVTPGNIDIATESEVLGGDALIRRSFCRWGWGKVDLLFGYQFASIDESLVIADASTDADPANLIADGTILSITDRFTTQNEFHGVTIGATGQFEQDSWRMDLMGKIGFGSMNQSVQIAGQTIVDAPPIGVVDAVNQFGLLAQNTNLGTFSQDRFAVSPELTAKVTYHVTDSVDVWAGYTFVYWSRVAQPGKQIDPDLRTPPDRFSIRDSEYWIHALTLGGQVQF